MTFYLEKEKSIWIIVFFFNLIAIVVVKTLFNLIDSYIFDWEFFDFD